MAALTELTDFIPRGLDSRARAWVLGERGMRMASGEPQRSGFGSLAIGRMIIGRRQAMGLGRGA